MTQQTLPAVSFTDLDAHLRNMHGTLVYKMGDYEVEHAEQHRLADAGRLPADHIWTPHTHLVCPECGTVVEVSAKVWLVMKEDGTFEPGFASDFTSEESSFYCRNDHNLDVYASEHGWYDTLQTWIESRLLS